MFHCDTQNMNEQQCHMLVIKTAIVVTLVVILGIAPYAHAHNTISGFSILVQIRKVEAFGSYSGDVADFYPIIQIDNIFGTGKTCGSDEWTIDDRNLIEPNWECEMEINSAQLLRRDIPVTIRIMNDDAGLFFGDEIVDIYKGSATDLNLIISMTDDMFDPIRGSFERDGAGSLIDGNNPIEREGVFRPSAAALLAGRLEAWESMPPGFLLGEDSNKPGGALYGANLFSSGNSFSDESAKIEYKIFVLAVPDFRVTAIQRASGGGLNVTVSNNGEGLGVLTRIKCRRDIPPGGVIEREVNIQMKRFEDRIINVALNPLNPDLITCEVSGQSQFRNQASQPRPEPHSHNNSLQRSL